MRMYFKMKNINKIVIGLLLLSLIISTYPNKAYAAEKQYSATEKQYSNEEIISIAEGIVSWKKHSLGVNENDNLINDKSLKTAGETNVDWYVIGLGRLGLMDDFESYLATVYGVVKKKYSTDALLDMNKATEWHRISLAILASGGDPTDINQSGNKNNINLIADGTYNRGKVASLGRQGINGWIWSLIALDSYRYEVPNDSFDTRDSIITEIISKQLSDGSFAIVGEGANEDITAMALQALSPYFNSEQSYNFVDEKGKNINITVRESVNKALDYMSKIQTSTGSFSSWSENNLEINAQTIVALCSLGIDPETDDRFIKNDNTVIDALLEYKTKEGGFLHEINDNSEKTVEPDSMAGEQALCALAALYRFKQDMRNLYDFRAEMSTELKKEILSLDNDIGIQLLSKNSSKSDVEGLFKRYKKIPITERSYVRNYSILADSMKDLGIENDSEYLAEKMGENKGGKANHSLVFSENDLAEYNALPEIMSTEYAITVSGLLTKLESMENNEQYADILADLNSKNETIIGIEKEIEAINSEISENLYPFNDIAKGDKELIDELIKRTENLSDYDRLKVLGYEDLKRAKAQLDGGTRKILITICFAILVIVGIGMVAIRMRKRRNIKKESAY